MDDDDELRSRAKVLLAGHLIAFEIETADTQEGYDLWFDELTHQTEGFRERDWLGLVCAFAAWASPAWVAQLGHRQSWGGNPIAAAQFRDLMDTAVDHIWDPS